MADKYGRIRAWGPLDTLRPEEVSAEIEKLRAGLNEVYDDQTATESVLASSFTLDQDNGVYQEVTGISISLPAAGTYRIYADVKGQVKFSAGTTAWITAKFYNSTDSADVANSEREIVMGNAVNLQFNNTVPMNTTITVAGAKTIKLYAFRNGATTWTTSLIQSDANGRTNLGYERVKKT